MRVDLLLKHLCLVKSRNRAGKGCQAGNIRLDGRAIKPSRDIKRGDILEIRYPGKDMVVEILDIPGKQVSRKERDQYIRTIREEPD